MELPKSILRVMNVLWDRGDVSAKTISEALEDRYGWNKNTTYTVIHQCIKKELIKRTNPGFLCHALVSRAQAQTSELNHLVDTMFGGSPKFLFSALVSGKTLSQADVDELKALIRDLE